MCVRLYLYICANGDDVTITIISKVSSIVNKINSVNMINRAEGSSRTVGFEE
jgi:hypothetical protein